MPRSVVCDAGGVLVVSGALEGRRPADDVEVLALDWTAITVGRYVSMQHEGDAIRARLELGIALAVVHEWFPVRTLVADTVERGGLEIDALDSWSALLLAEQLDLPLFTASDDVHSTRVDVLRPW